jgi:hypothetical protein
MKAYDWYKQTPTEEHVRAQRKARKYLIDIGLRM